MSAPSDLQKDTFELLSILLVSHGDRGSHLLFKYPYPLAEQDISKPIKPAIKKNQYVILPTDNLNSWTSDKDQKSIHSNDLLCGLGDDVLASLCLSSKANKEMLELKIENIFFLGSQDILKVDINTLKVVFALRSPLPRPVIKCYQSLSLAISKALMKAETYNQYLSSQTKKLADLMDEHQNIDQNNRPINYKGFKEALEKCQLAKELKLIYDSIKKDGIINILLSNCVNLSFCLPHLAYKVSEKCEQTYFVEIIFDAIKYLRPFMGILLLGTREDLLRSLPYNCNHNTKVLIEKYNPFYSLARYAAEMDVPINEIYAIVNHLIYWAKIKLIYPITENNLYILHPNAPLYLNSKISKEFSETFENASFHHVLAQISKALPLVDHLDGRMSRDKQTTLINMIVWLLQRNVIVQLHTYLYLMPKKFEHQRLKCEQYSQSKISEVSLDEESEFNLDGNRLALASIGGELANLGGSAGSEHSNDTENLDQKDVSAVYENYREIFNEHKISERDQVYILKSFENKSEQDVRLFMQLMPYYNGMTNIEAIIYYEQINRYDLITFLDKFKDLIMTSTYEDQNPLVRLPVKIT